MRMGVVVLVVVIFLSSQGFAQENVEIDDQLSQFDYEALRLASIFVITSYRSDVDPEWTRTASSSGFIIQEEDSLKLIAIRHAVIPFDEADISWTPYAVSIVIPHVVDDEGNIITTDTFESLLLSDAEYRENAFFDGLVSWDLSQSVQTHLEDNGYTPLVLWNEETQIPLLNLLSVTSVKTYDEMGQHGHFIDPILYQVSTFETVFSASLMSEDEREEYQSVYGSALTLDVIDATDRKQNENGEWVEMGPCLGYSGTGLIVVSVDTSGRLGIYTDELGRPYVVGSFSSMTVPNQSYIRNYEGDPVPVFCIDETGYVFVTAFYGEN